MASTSRTEAFRRLLTANEDSDVAPMSYFPQSAAKFREQLAKTTAAQREGNFTKAWKKLVKALRYITGVNWELVARPERAVAEEERGWWKWGYDWISSGAKAAFFVSEWSRALYDLLAVYIVAKKGIDVQYSDNTTGNMGVAQFFDRLRVPGDPTVPKISDILIPIMLINAGASITLAVTNWFTKMDGPTPERVPISMHRQIDDVYQPTRHPGHYITPHPIPPKQSCCSSFCNEVICCLPRKWVEFTTNKWVRRAILGFECGYGNAACMGSWCCGNSFIAGLNALSTFTGGVAKIANVTTVLIGGDTTAAINASAANISAFTEGVASCAPTAGPLLAGIMCAILCVERDEIINCLYRKKSSRAKAIKQSLDLFEKAYFVVKPLASIALLADRILGLAPDSETLNVMRSILGCFSGINVWRIVGTHIAKFGIAAGEELQQIAPPTGLGQSWFQSMGVMLKASSRIVEHFAKQQTTVLVQQVQDVVVIEQCIDNSYAQTVVKIMTSSIFNWYARSIPRPWFDEETHLAVLQRWGLESSRPPVKIGDVANEMLQESLSKILLPGDTPGSRFIQQSGLVLGTLGGNVTTIPLQTMESQFAGVPLFACNATNDCFIGQTNNSIVRCDINNTTRTVNITTAALPTASLNLTNIMESARLLQHWVEDGFVNSASITYFRGNAMFDIAEFHAGKIEEIAAKEIGTLRNATTPASTRMQLEQLIPIVQNNSQAGDCPLLWPRLTLPKCNITILYLPTWRPTPYVLQKDGTYVFVELHHVQQTQQALVHVLAGRNLDDLAVANTTQTISVPAAASTSNKDENEEKKYYLSMATDSHRNQIARNADSSLRQVPEKKERKHGKPKKE